MITFGLTKKPPTDIQSPFANAVNASATTKMGNRLDMRTTNDSAATRSRNNHIIQVKNAVADGRKLHSQYVITLKRTDIRNRYGSPMRKFAMMKDVGP